MCCVAKYLAFHPILRSIFDGLSRGGGEDRCLQVQQALHLFEVIQNLASYGNITDLVLREALHVSHDFGLVGRQFEQVQVAKVEVLFHDDT